MNRLPVYHQQDGNYRVVYVPGGHWVAQQRSDRKNTRESDPWDNLGELQHTQEAAMQVMYSRKPL